MQLRQNAANYLTLLNLLAGTTAVYLIFEGRYIEAFWWVLAGIGFDFLDGLVARALRVHSPLGLQLDSLADMVTSGLAPAYFLFHIMHTAYPDARWPFVAFLIAPASAWRLARFNIDPAQKDRFRGLPTPANALFLFAMGFILLRHIEPWFGLISRPAGFTGLILLSCWLLNSSLPLIALKFHGFDRRKDGPKILLALILLGMLVAGGWAAVPWALAIYVVYSWFYYRKKPLP